MKRFRESLGFREDGFGGFGPDEGCGVIIVVLKVAVDGGLQLGNGAEDAAAQATSAALWDFPRPVRRV